MMLSGFQVSTSPEPDFSNFDTFATAMGCTQSLGSSRLQCLRNVSASTIQNYTNGNSLFDAYVVDKYGVLSCPRRGAHDVGSVTVFDDPLQRIRAGQVAQVPILIGNAQDDGTIFAYNTSESLSAFLKKQFGRHASRVPPSLVRSLYPGLTDLQVIDAVERDIQFRWCVLFLL